jgi:hypothetical protein
MRKPDVEYQADDIIIGFVRHAAGSGTQEVMIGCEILFAAGLASRDLILVERELTMKFEATPALATRLEHLTAPVTKHKKS